MSKVFQPDFSKKSSPITNAPLPKNNNVSNSKFEPHLQIDEAEEKCKSEPNKFKKGTIRCSKSDGYVSRGRVDLLSSDSDYFVQGLKNRNRSFDGDVVVIELLETHLEKNEKNEKNENDEDDSPNFTINTKQDQCFAKVVCILKRASHDFVVTLTANVLPSEKDENGCLDNASDNPKTIRPDEQTILSTDKFIRATPVSPKLPWMLVLTNDFIRKKLSLSPFNQENPHISGKLEKTIYYKASFCNWYENSNLPLVKLDFTLDEIEDYTPGTANSQPEKRPRCIIGKAGTPAAEIRAALVANDLEETHLKPFSKNVIRDAEQSLRENSNVERELEKTKNNPFLPVRRDLRNKRVFTIDPATAKDLDDAIHIDQIDENLVEVGVHIADVSHFVAPNSPLDENAKKRCTTVYCPYRAFPMLPETLSNDVCSLHPGQAKLTFTVTFQIEISTGKILTNKTEYFKSSIFPVIRLNYDEVQEILEGRELATIPQIYTHQRTYNWETIKKDLHLLHRVTGIIRKNRFKNGSLSIKGSKLVFDLEEIGHLPRGYEVEESNVASHWLIEELMLIANRLVAEFTMKYSPDGRGVSCEAVVRNHKVPKPKMVTAATDYLSKIGISLNMNSAIGLYDSLNRIYNGHGPNIGRVVEFMVLVSMNSAEYHVYGSLLENKESPMHFALAFESYTHFTSPIRRYADVMVHRNLYEILCDFHAKTKRFKEISIVNEGGLNREKIDSKSIKLSDLQDSCDKSNAMKVKSRKCQEQCDRAFFSIFLREGTGSRLYTTGVVRQIDDKSLIVFCPQVSMEKRIYYELPSKSNEFYVKDEYLNGRSIDEYFEDDIVYPSKFVRQSTGENESAQWIKFYYGEPKPSGLTAPPGLNPIKEEENMNNYSSSLTLSLFSIIPIVLIPVVSIPIDFEMFMLPVYHEKYQPLIDSIETPMGPSILHGYCPPGDEEVEGAEDEETQQQSIDHNLVDRLDDLSFDLSSGRAMKHVDKRDLQKLINAEKSRYYTEGMRSMKKFNDE